MVRKIKQILAVSATCFFVWLTVCEEILRGHYMVKITADDEEHYIF